MTGMDYLVAKALNRYSDNVFTEALSECDCTGNSELSKECFGNGLA